MATASDQDDDKKLICPTCFEPFNSPRVLPCLHTFCKECLDADIKSQIEYNSHFVCPFCKTAPSTTTDEVEHCNDTFPLNNIITYLMKSFEDTPSSDKYCQPCEVENHTNPAEVWCVDCQEQLCGSCKRSHQGMKITKDHKLITIEERRQNQQTRKQKGNIQDCLRHPGQRLETYCNEHFELCCSICRIVNHRACENVRKIVEIADEQNTYSKNLEEVNKLQVVLNKFIEEKMSNLIVLGLEKDEMVHEINIAIDKAITKLKEQRKQFNDKMESIYSCTKSSLQQKLRSTQAFMKNIGNLKLVIKGIEKNVSVQENFIMYETFLSQVRSHYQQLINETKIDTEETHFVLKLNSFLVNLDESLSTLGTFQTCTRKSPILIEPLAKIDDIMKNMTLQAKMNTKMCAAQVDKIDLMASPVSHVKSVTRQGLGRQAYFSGGTFLSDGRLVMVNRNSNRLVEFDSNYNIVMEHQLYGCPSDVSAGNTNNEVYVVMNDKHIHKYKLGAKLTELSKIKLPEDAWGIAVSDDEFIVVATKQNLLVVTQGEVVPVIQQWKADGFPYVAVSRSQKTFYHRDGEAVVCREFDGNEMFRYKPGRLRARGVCLDMHNNVYVCSVGVPYASIHQVSADGKRSRILIEKLYRLLAPLSLMFNLQQNELIVTSNAEDTVFEVYRLG